MNIIAMGIGPYGNAVAEQLCSNNALSRCIAVCSTKSEFESSKVETKIRVSTRLSPPDAIERINGKLSKACAEADMAVLIANPIDFANPSIINLIAEHIQRMNVTLVGVVFNSAKKTDRKHKNSIRNTIERMVNSFATVVIPEGGVVEYTEPINTRWLHTYTSMWEGRDTIQEQEAFHKWKKTMPASVNSIPKGIQVGTFAVCRLVNTISASYVNAEKSNIIDVLSVPGPLHISTVYASGKDRYELIKWRASFNDILLTTSHAAKGMLLTLTVPKTMIPDEAGKICLGIYSYANESVNFYFNINFSEYEDENEVVAASVIATGTLDALDDW